MAGRTLTSAASFRDFVLDQLVGLGDVECRAMFGGHGLYSAGTFFAIVFRGRLYFRTDDTTRGEYLARGMGPFRPSPGQQLGTYYEVPPEILEDSGALERWAQTALRSRRGRSRSVPTARPPSTAVRARRRPSPASRSGRRTRA